MSIEVTESGNVINEYIEIRCLIQEQLIYGCITLKYFSTVKQFQNGRHVVRRPERLLDCLLTDLVIEQTLMRSIKRF